MTIQLARLNTLVFAIAFGLAACAQGDGRKSDSASAETSSVEDGNDLVEILIPAHRRYEYRPQARLNLPRRLTVCSDGADDCKVAKLLLDASGVFQPIPEGTFSSGDVSLLRTEVVISSVVTRSLIGGDYPYLFVLLDGPSEQSYGLDYRAERVPSRPENLWKRAYLKPNISGELFHILCMPGISPGAISPPFGCTMTLMLITATIGGRRVGLEVSVAIPVTRLDEWQVIENAVRGLIEQNAVWVEG